MDVANKLFVHAACQMHGTLTDNAVLFQGKLFACFTIVLFIAEFKMLGPPQIKLHEKHFGLGLIKF